MSFVFSIWYIVMILLVAGIAACLVVFFKMDKKDRVLIDQFIKGQQPAEAKEEEVEVKEEKSNE